MSGRSTSVKLLAWIIQQPLKAILCLGYCLSLNLKKYLVFQSLDFICFKYHAEEKI